MRGSGSLKAAGGALAALLMATTPVLAQPQRPDQQASKAGYAAGRSGDNRSPYGGNNTSTGRAFNEGHKAGARDRGSDNFDDIFDGAKNQKDASDIGNTGGFNGPNSHPN